LSPIIEKVDQERVGHTFVALLLIHRMKITETVQKNEDVVEGIGPKVDRKKVGMMVGRGIS
jgi:hypothetical protein